MSTLSQWDGVVSGTTPKYVIVRAVFGESCTQDDDHKILADKILAELDAAGFVIVPKEATEKMLAASHMIGLCWYGGEPVSTDDIATSWSEMVDAAIAEQKS